MATRYGTPDVEYPRFDLLRDPRVYRVASKVIELARNGEIFIGDDDGTRPDDHGHEGARLGSENEPPGSGSIAQDIGELALNAA